MNTSINADKGTTINELELTFRVCEKLLKAKISENPKSGYIMNKGQKNEARIKYTQALECLRTLYDQFAADGAFSFGICKTCKKFTPLNDEGVFGKCTAHGNTQVYCYNSCCNHSKSGGGFGL